MVNIKYYLILLICMFLSLGLGMVIGISLQNKNVLEKQYDMISQRLEDEFLNMRNENQQLKDTLKTLEKLEKENAALYESVFNSIIRNKLNGSRITLIEMGSEDDYSDIIDLLKVAGASIGPSLAFDASLFREEYELDNTINVSSQTILDKGQLYVQLAENIMISLTRGELTPLIQRLSLTHGSAKIQNGCNTIVLAYSSIGNAKRGIDKFVHNLVRVSKDYNFNIIAIEKKESNLIDAVWCKKNGISTIDHVNTLYGKISLISLLYGDKGNYGYAEGTDGILPNELFPQNPEDQSLDRDSIETDDLDIFEKEVRQN
ncbi:MAG: copper transporter [Caldicoprobacterales bacterium]|jgi:hypothetical protein|nr:copper transporter [Clostridiales bacterium]